MNLVASSDIDLSKFDRKIFPQKNALRQAISKVNGLWNKISRSIAAAETCHANMQIMTHNLLYSEILLRSVICQNLFEEVRTRI